MRTVVIGGGLQGLSTAMALAERGESVRVLEARDEIGRETSFANGGLITPSMPEPWNGPGVFGELARSFSGRSALRLRLRALPGLAGWGFRFLRHATRARYLAATEQAFRLARYSLEQHLEIAERIAAEYDVARRGVITVFRKAEDMTARLELCGLLAKSGMRYSVLDGDAAVAAEPSLAGIRDRIGSAILFHDDVSGDAHRFCRSLAAALSRRGVTLDVGTRVTRLDVRRGEVAGAVTDSGTVAADRVVVAAGVRSAALLRTAGVRIAIQPVKGYSVTINLPDGVAGPELPVMDDAAHSLVTPLGRRLRAVGTAEFGGFDTRIDAARIAALVRAVQALAPALPARLDPADVSPWAGLRPMSADGLPYVGATKVPGLFVNSGHGQLGWTLASGSARMLADIVCGTPPAVDPAPFRVDR